MQAPFGCRGPLPCCGVRSHLDRDAVGTGRVPENSAGEPPSARHNASPGQLCTAVKAPSLDVLERLAKAVKVKVGELVA